MSKTLKVILGVLGVIVVIAVIIALAICITALVKNDTFVNVAESWWVAIKDWFATTFTQTPEIPEIVE